MRRNGDSWLISDIYLDGAISEVATRRSEFAAILKKEGIDGLIAALTARPTSSPRPQPNPSRNLWGGFLARRRIEAEREPLAEFELDAPPSIGGPEPEHVPLHCAAFR